METRYEKLCKEVNRKFSTALCLRSDGIKLKSYKRRPFAAMYRVKVEKKERPNTH